jgi:hypothetical protein
LVVVPVILGIYVAPILDAIHFSASSLLYMFDFDLDIIGFFAPTFVYKTRSESPEPDLTRAVENKGLSHLWRHYKANMTLSEQLMHIKADLDYSKDKLKTGDGDTSYLTKKITALTSERNATKRLLDIERQSDNTQGASDPMAIKSVLNSKSVGVFITSSRLTVSSFVRRMVINLMPLFNTLIPLLSVA